MVMTDKKRQRKQRWEKIMRSGYNKWYRRVKREEIPGYLRKG